MIRENCRIIIFDEYVLHSFDTSVLFNILSSLTLSSVQNLLWNAWSMLVELFFKNIIIHNKQSLTNSLVQIAWISSFASMNECFTFIECHHIPKQHRNLISSGDLNDSNQVFNKYPHFVEHLVFASCLSILVQIINW